MKLLDRNKILSAKLKTITINIPEWGGDVLIKEPTGYERAEYELLISKASNDDNFLKEIRAICAAKCLIDEKGKRLFSDDDIKLLQEVSANALDRVIDAYREISIVSDEAITNTAKN